MSASARASSSHAPRRPTLSRGGYSVSGHESTTAAAAAQILQGRRTTGRVSTGLEARPRIPERPHTVNTDSVCSQQARGCFTYPGGHRERAEVLRRLQRAKNFSSKVNTSHASRRIGGSDGGKAGKLGRNTSTRSGETTDHRESLNSRPGKEPWQAWPMERQQTPQRGGLSDMAGRGQHEASMLGDEWRGLGSGAHMHEGPVLLSTTGKLTHGGLIQHALDVHTDAGS